MPCVSLCGSAGRAILCVWRGFGVRSCCQRARLRVCIRSRGRAGRGGQCTALRVVRCPLPWECGAHYLLGTPPPPLVKNLCPSLAVRQESALIESSIRSFFTRLTLAAVLAGAELSQELRGTAPREGRGSGRGRGLRWRRRPPEPFAVCWLSRRWVGLALRALVASGVLAWRAWLCLTFAWRACGVCVRDVCVRGVCVC